MGYVLVTYPAKRVPEDVFSNVSMQTLAGRRTALLLTSVTDCHINPASAVAVKLWIQTDREKNSRRTRN